MNDFWSELKRRNVYRVGVAYAVIGWAIAQVADLLADNFGTPEWVMRTLLLALLAGLPVALILAWIYELTPEGVRRSDDVERSPSTGQRRRGGALTWITSIALVLALGFIAFDRLGPSPDRTSNAGTASIDKSVAVLPFADLSENGDQEWLADGLTEEILNSLTRLPELKVTARTSSFAFEDSDEGIGEIAAKLGVAHIVEGSVRRIGNDLRITAQLIRADDDTHAWSDSYDRNTEDLFEVQRDVAENIATALDVVLDEEKRRRLFASGTRDVAAFEAYRRGVEIFNAAHDWQGSSGTANTLAAANVWFDRALEHDPRFAQAALLRADIYAHLLVGEGARIGEVDADTAVDPLAAYRENLDFVVEMSAEGTQRIGAMIAREYLAPSWRRLPRLVEQLKAAIESGAGLHDEFLWADDVLVMLDESETVERISAKHQTSDPLNPRGWELLMSARLRAGKLDEAKAILAEMKARFPDNNNDDRELVIALGTGDASAASSLLDEDRKLSGRFSHYEATYHALRGDADRARRAAANHDDGTGPAPAGLLWTYLILGDDERLLSLLKRIDSAPAGPATLATFLFVYGGNLPFSLEDAPNFRRNLLEAGVDLDSLSRVTWPTGDL